MSDKAPRGSRIPVFWSANKSPTAAATTHVDSQSESSKPQAQLPKPKKPDRGSLLSSSNQIRRSVVEPDSSTLWKPSAVSTPQVTALRINQRVTVGDDKTGVLRYCGPLDFDAGIFCGVELDEPEGLNDGYLRGVQYFRCRPQHGIIAPASKVTPLPANHGTIPVPHNQLSELKSTPPTMSGSEDQAVRFENGHEELTYILDKQPSPAHRTPTPGSSAGSNHNGLAWDWSYSAGQRRPASGQQRPPELKSQLSKQSSFEQDESSLGILTPDQMTDFANSLDSPSTGRTPSFEDMPPFLSHLMTDVKPGSCNIDIPLSARALDATFILDPRESERRNAAEDRMELIDDISCTLIHQTIDSTDTVLVDSETNSGCSSLNIGATYPHVPFALNDDALSFSRLTREDPMDDANYASYIEDQRVTFVDSRVSLDSCDPSRFVPGEPGVEPEDLSVADKLLSTHSNSVKVDMSDRTLSPEDLPLDGTFQDSAPAEMSKSTTGDLPEAMSGDASNRSGAAVEPTTNSFVTSVTSITSLDNGYQGDGEWSRPASRGADHSPTTAARHHTLKMKPDPMTDSDFFTESDADVHDELSAIAGVGRGDRRAQVIDGTLYGCAVTPANGCGLLASNGVPLNHRQRCPSFTASINEEMESSGVYSDLEQRKTDEPVNNNNLDQQNSPDESTRTMSDQSQLKESEMNNQHPFQTRILADDSTVSEDKDMSGVLDDTMILNENLKNQQQSLLVTTNCSGNTLIEDASEMPKLEETYAKADAIVVVVNNTSGQPVNKPQTLVSKPPVKEEMQQQQHQLKKYKMPKRNVESKIKAMLVSSAAIGNTGAVDENQENRRPPRINKSPRKNGRWDAVMNKIAQGQADQKLSQNRLREVKSKVFVGLSTVPTLPPGSEGPSRQTSSLRKASVSSSSPRILKESSPLKSKSRRARTRASSTSLQQSGGGRGGSANSSPHSSLSDVSVAPSLSKASTKSVTSLRSSKKRDVGRSTSPLSDGSTNSANSNVINRTPNNASLNHSRPSSHSSVRERSLNGGVPTDNCGVPKRQRSLLGSSGTKRVQLVIGGEQQTRQEKSGANVEMKSPASKKLQQPRRPLFPPTPKSLRHHNRQQAGGVALPERPKGGGVQKLAPPAPQQQELQQQPPANLQIDLLLPQLRHATIGFEALATLVHYLTYTLDAFSTPRLKEDLESIKIDWVKTKLELEEVRVSYRRKEEQLESEQASHLSTVDRLEASHSAQLAAARELHEQEMTRIMGLHALQIKGMEKTVEEQMLEATARHDAERCRLEAEHAVQVEDMLSDAQDRLDALKTEHGATKRTLMLEAEEREAQLQERLAAVEEDFQQSWRRVLDSMHKDRDTKIQATAVRCKQLQDEVESLRTVLDLRMKEMQQLRRQNESLRRDSEELPLVQQKAQVLQARVEDLEVQLQIKTSFERQLSHENKVLHQSYQQESQQKKRLSLHNEELQWKLKQNTEVVNVLAALSTSVHQLPSGVSSPGQLHARSPAHYQHHHHHHNSAAGLAKSCTQLLSDGDVVGQRITRSSLSDEDSSTPASPKVKAVVEKSDSVSWVLEIGEPAGDLVSRLVRRSFRSSASPPCVAKRQRSSVSADATGAGGDSSSGGSSPPPLLASLPQPKDSAGEAMVSEETSEDERDLNNGSSSCSEERSDNEESYCSESCCSDAELASPNIA